MAAVCCLQHQTHKDANVCVINVTLYLNCTHFLPSGVKKKKKGQSDDVLIARYIRRLSQHFADVAG